MATIGLINLLMRANSAPFTKDIKKASDSIGGMKKEAASAESSFGSFSAGLKGMGAALAGVGAALGAAAIAASLKSFVQESMSSVVATARLSDRLGVATEDLIGLQHAASQSLGADQVEAFTDALSDMQEKIGDVTLEEGGAKDILKILGLDAAKLKTQDAVTNFKQIADAISKVKSKAEKLHIADTLFGGQGQKLLPLLEQGSAGIERFAAEAQNLGLNFSRVDAAKVEQANAAMGRLGAVIQGTGQQLAIGLAPYIEAAANALTNMGAQGIDVAGYVDSAMGMMSSSIGVVADVIHTVGLGWEALEAVAATAVSSMMSGVASLGDGVQTVTKVVTDFDLSWQLLGATGATVGEGFLMVLATLGDGLEVVINYVPYLKEVVASLGIGWTAMGGAAAQAFATTLSTLATVGEGVEWLLNQIPGVEVSFGTALQDMAKQAQEFADTSFAEVNDALNKPIDTSGVDDFFQGLRDTADNASQFSEDSWNEFNSSLEATPNNQAIEGFFNEVEAGAAGAAEYADTKWAEFNDSLMAAPPSEGINNFFDEIKSGAAEAAQEIADSKKPIDELGDSFTAAAMKVGELEAKLKEQLATYGKSSAEVEIYKLKQLGASDEQLAAAKKLSDQLKAKSVIESNMTPIEKYKKEIGELRELLSSGAIDKATFDRASQKLGKDSGMSELKFAAATELGSNEARSAILRHQGIGSRDPNLGVEKNTNVIASESKKQTSILNQVAKQLAANEAFSFN